MKNLTISGFIYTVNPEKPPAAVSQPSLFAAGQPQPRAEHCPRRRLRVIGRVVVEHGGGGGGGGGARRRILRKEVVEGVRRNGAEEKMTGGGGERGVHCRNCGRRGAAAAICGEKGRICLM
ncbi:hypothetical protein Droror1_Dr00007497 [Drosera rotundifolia]